MLRIEAAAQAPRCTHLNTATAQATPPTGHPRNSMTRFVSLPLALAAALAVTLSACGGNDDKGSAPPPPVASTPTVTASAPPAPTVDPATGLVVRSTEDLTTGLLELSDLPAGFAREDDDPA